MSLCQYYNKIISHGWLLWAQAQWLTGALPSGGAAFKNKTCIYREAYVGKSCDGCSEIPLHVHVSPVFYTVILINHLLGNKWDCIIIKVIPASHTSVWNEQKNSVGSKSSKNIIWHPINTICTWKEMMGGRTKQSQICLRRGNTRCVAKQHYCHLYALETRIGGLSLNVKTSGQSRAISSDALLTLAPADECGVSHE